MTVTTTPVTSEPPERTALVVPVAVADGEPTRTVELPGEVFDVQVNIPLIHQVVVAQLAAARQGTHSTKTRGEVSGGGRKPYRQKGTGRARQGSTRAPQFAGGGVVHGPTPRDYSQRTPRKMKAAALRGALTDRARNGRVHVLESVVAGDVPSTRTAVAALASITDRRHVLVVAERTDELAWRSLRNVPRIHLIDPGQLNTYDVLVSDDVVFTERALRAFLTTRPKGRVATGRARSSEPGAALDSTSLDSTSLDSTSLDLTPHELPGSSIPSVVTPETPSVDGNVDQTPAPTPEPATDAGTTAPAGEGPAGEVLSTEAVADEVLGATDKNLLVETAYESTGTDDLPAGAGGDALQREDER